MHCHPERKRRTFVLAGSPDAAGKVQKSFALAQDDKGVQRNYRPNCTVTRAPAGTCVPAAGDCCRATPLPTGSSSRPASWATSSALRTVLPTNDGTTIPPCSTSSTTVPVEGSGAGGTSALFALGAEDASSTCSG